MSLRTLSLALLAAVAVLPAPSYAADGPAGSPCRLYATAPQDDPETFSAVLLGGPYAGTGTLTCTVQVGAAAHSGPDSATASGVALVPPTPVRVPWTGAPMYVCTSFASGTGPAVYWSSGAWTDDPAAPCDAYRDSLDTSAGVGQELDVVVCPVLVALRPGVGPVVITATGDLYIAGTFVWDCPPYAT